MMLLVLIAYAEQYLNDPLLRFVFGLEGESEVDCGLCGHVEGREYRENSKCVKGEATPSPSFKNDPCAHQPIRLVRCRNPNHRIHPAERWEVPRPPLTAGRGAALPPLRQQNHLLRCL
jgi:hypothetical protein